MSSDRSDSNVLVIDASLAVKLTIENPAKPIVERYFTLVSGKRNSAVPKK